MRPRTALALALLLLGAAGVGFVALSGDAGGSLTVDWTSETARPNQVNHHPVVAERVDGEAYIAAPVSTVEPKTANCSLVVLDWAGRERWTHSTNDSACAIHGLGDPAFLDADADNRTEIAVSTTENRLYTFDARSGRVEFRVPLSTFGYSQPALVTSPAHRTVVADFDGNVFAVGPNGSVAWNRSLGTVVVADVRVTDLVGDSTREIAVGGSKRLVVFEPNGSTVWSRNVSTQYLVSATVADDPRLFAAKGETVTALAGDGSVLWRASPGSRPAMRAVTDGDGDGEQELYVAVRGTVLALDARSGAVEWKTTLAPDTLLPSPSVGDVDGDGRPEVVAVTNDGTVSVLDPANGEVLASHSREVKIWTHATVADYDADGRAEILVMYGDGRVVSLSYRT